jgi:hypothetical protein
MKTRKFYISKNVLQSGDLFAVVNKGLIGRFARRFMAPFTDRFHYGLIWDKTPDGDYLILESISKGIAVGRLSFYKGEDIKFYRVNCPGWKRRLVPLAVTRYGRSQYDYILVFKIMIQGFWLLLKQLFLEGRFRRIFPWELSWCRDNRFICTEVPDAGYDLVGEPILPDAMAPVPAAYRWAELEGKIVEVKYKL